MALCLFCSTAFLVTSALSEYIPLQSVTLIVPSHPLPASLRCVLHSDKVDTFELNVKRKRAPTKFETGWREECPVF